jgi:chitosanase
MPTGAWRSFHDQISDTQAAPRLSPLTYPRPVKVVAIGVALCLVIAGCGDDDDTADSTAATSAAEPVSTGGLTADQRRRVDQLVSTFENSTTEIQYGYAENIDDGRGVTAGRAGFTTATCDALTVIELYTERTGDNGLAGFVPELERLCDEGSDDTSGLPEDAYVTAWQEAAADHAFRQAQDDVVDQEYFLPAMEIADELQLETALARAQLYDTALQHGAGDDPDGLFAIIDRTSAAVGTPAEAGETPWLDEFFAQRIATLENPANPDTAEDWRESVSRVECMQSIAATGNFDLDGPIQCTVYGDEFTIDAAAALRRDGIEAVALTVDM